MDSDNKQQQKQQQQQQQQQQLFNIQDVDDVDEEEKLKLFRESALGLDLLSKVNLLSPLS